MSLLLLDTTFLIDVERGGADLDDLIADDDDVAMAAVTVAELTVGARLASKRHRQARHDFVAAMVEALPVIPYDLAVAAAHADLLIAVRRMGTPRGAHDLIIAATARASARSVVTADRAGFADLPGVTVVDHRPD